MLLQTHLLGGGVEVLLAEQHNYEDPAREEAQPEYWGICLSQRHTQVTLQHHAPSTDDDVAAG
jgi:hypothetical protein